MTRDVRLYINDMLEALEKIEEYTENVSEDDFFEDTQLQDAIVRRIEILGESVKHIPQDIRDKYPEIPWRQISGMRDILTHEYFGINMSKVWKAITEDNPEIKENVLKIKRDLDKKYKK